MNDVLAKPFTREGMVRILKKHLTKLLKNPPPPGSTDAADMASPGMQHGPNASYANAMAAQAQMSMQQQMAVNNVAAAAAAAAQMQHMQQAVATPGGGGGAQVKFEGTPMPSPTASSSWHSPGGQMAAAAAAAAATTAPQQQHVTSPAAMDGGGGYLGHQVGGGGGAQMALTPGGSQRHQQHQQYLNSHALPQMGTPRMPTPGGGPADVMAGLPGQQHRGGGDDRPEKRQRMAYGQGYA